MIGERLTEYAGLPVVDFLEDEEDRPTPSSVVWRLHSMYSEEGFLGTVDRLVQEVDTSKVTALVIGDWGIEGGNDLSSAGARDALIEHAAAFPALRSLFLGDITFEMSEISWLQQSDLAPLLVAYPALEELAVRGVGDTYVDPDVLALHVPGHPSLRSLTVQSGGLPGRVVREIVSSAPLPLERLELWLGVEHYGYDVVPEDLAPVLSGEVFPDLRHLGLRNAQDTGDWARRLTASPLLARLTSVDLSLGSLRGKDVEHLIASVPLLAHLESLDLHHHYLSEEETERVRAAFAETDVRVDLSDRREVRGDEDDLFTYYPSVGE